MQHAHDRGIIHRDLKPANVLVVSGQWSVVSQPKNSVGSSLNTDHQPLTPLKITDFGLAKRLDTASGDTESGTVLGTASYMSPEQASGRNSTIDARSDIYALGAILYELLTGRPPFKAASPIETIAQVLGSEVLTPSRLQPGVPRDLENICLKCLQKEPQRRYASAAELAEDLNRFLNGRSVLARSTPPWEQAWKWARRKPLIAGLSAALVLVTATALILIIGQWQRAEDEADQARKARGVAETRRKSAEETEARLALRQGQALCEQGEIAHGLLWLARGLERADSAGADHLQRPFRVNLAEWGNQFNRLCPVVSNPSPVMTLTFDSSGRYLLTGGKDGRIRYWDLRDNREVEPSLAVPRTVPGSIGAVALSPDGRTLAVGSNAAVTLWDIESHRQLGEPLPHPEGMVGGVAFLTDGKRLVSCSEDGSFRIWDIETRRLTKMPGTITRNRGRSVLAHSNSAGTAMAAQDGIAGIWDLDRFEFPSGGIMRHSSNVRALAFSRDGSQLFTGTERGTLHAWNSGQGPTIERGKDLPGQGSEVTALVVSPDGHQFATGTVTGIVRFWQTDSLRAIGPLYRCPAGVRALAFRPDGKLLALGLDSGEIMTVEAFPSFEAAPSTPLPPGNPSLRYTPSGTRLLAGTGLGGRWIDTSSGKTVSGYLAALEAGYPQCIVLAPDGQSVALGRTHNMQDLARARVDLLDIQGNRRWTTPPQTGAVCALAYTPDSNFLFSCGRTDLASGGALWDVSTGKLVRPLMSSLHVRIRFALFGPDTRRLILGCDDGQVLFWDMRTDSEIEPDRRIRYSASITALACNGAGTRLLVGYRDGSARLVDVQTREPVLPPFRHEAEVSVVAISPDGRTLLTGSKDGAARFWDAGTGEPLGPIRWHRVGLTAGTYHPSGERIALTGQDGSVHQWHAPRTPLDGSTEEVRVWAEKRTGLMLDDQGLMRESKSDGAKRE
jgi:WD40 repeat protein